jgi:hypothetical protein
MLNRMQDLIMPAGMVTPPGTLTEETYLAVAAELRKNDLIQAVPPYRQFFIPCGAHD